MRELGVLKRNSSSSSSSQDESDWEKSKKKKKKKYDDDDERNSMDEYFLFIFHECLHIGGGVCKNRHISQGLTLNPLRLSS